jgi:hypothetical protein
MCLFILKAAGFHYRCIPDDAKGTFEQGVAIETAERDTFLMVKEFYNERVNDLISQLPK